MKICIQILLASLCPVAITTAQTLSIDEPSAPTNAIVAQASHAGYTRTFSNHASQAKTTRGNTFLMPDTGDSNTDYTVTGLTLQKKTNQTFTTGDELQVWIFEWNPSTDGNDEANWILGNGTSDGDPLSGTGMTPLLTHTFSLDGLTFTNNQYFTIDLSASPLTFTENTAYGFLVGFVDGSGATGTYFQFGESGGVGQTGPYLEGREVRTFTVDGAEANTTYSPRDLGFYISGSHDGSGIPNPTITASSSLIEVGGSVDLDITFDVTADTAVLSTQGGPIDLKDIDAGDSVPNDGMVVVTDSPTSTYSYEVVLTKSGEDEVSANTMVQVADPSSVPTNSFSTAILSDSPLFYYRYEEAADSGYLTDVSGNGYHTANITGTLGQGNGPGGMQNAGEFPGSVGIGVPATSDTTAAYTMVAVVNSDNIQAGSKNIFSMTNGTGTGRSLFYLTNGTFETFVSGGKGTVIPATTMPTSQTSFLVHCVFDPDPDSDPITEDQEMSVYIDGTFQGSVTLGPIDANIGEWVLGSHKGQTFNFFNGWLDETAVFESALTDSQIAAHGTAFYAAADPLLGFASDTAETTSGGPVTLSWTTSDQAESVTLNGTDVDGSAGGGVYTATVYPTSSTTYTLVVSGPGGPFTKAIDVTIVSPPRITSIVADGSTPPNLTIEVLGAANTSYDIMASSNLVDGFPIPVGSVTTDATGVGTTSFLGDGTAEFYRLEIP